MPLVWDGKKWITSSAKQTTNSRTVQSAELETLKRSLKAQEINLQRQGGKVKHGGPSIINRVFDVLSRPNYAVAEGYRRLGKHGFGDLPAAVGDFAKGAVSGAAGKDKTTFSKVLKEENLLKGKPGGIAGFALDIALDPTTYVGLGL